MFRNSLLRNLEFTKTISFRISLFNLGFVLHCSKYKKIITINKKLQTLKKKLTKLIKLKYYEGNSIKKNYAKNFT